MMTACIDDDGSTALEAKKRQLGIHCVGQMSTFSLQAQETELRIVDLDSVRPSELEGFLRREHALWQDRLSWDVSAAVSAFRRAMERGGVSGKAVRCGASTAGYGYFIVEGGRGVMTGLAIGPEWIGEQVGPLLVRSMIRELSLRGVSRIESQFVSFDASWLAPCFEAEGFEAFPREFRRLRLGVQGPRGQATPSSGPFVLRSWKPWNLTEASQVMQRAHVSGIDARMNELYRSTDGCRSLLTSVLRHRGCGSAILDASTVARDPRTDRAVGFAVVTETSVRKAHLAQLAVAPDFQGRGLGRLLLTHTIERLSEIGYDGLSLMVSRENHRALDLYRSMGFELVIAFPVFSRD
jgi:ribosomal protein S18 acetylase RimI-like enzyme